MNTFKNLFILILFSGFLLIGCGSSEEQGATEQTEQTASSDLFDEPTEEEMRNSKGVGVITSLELGPIDDALASKGSEIFESKCTACHKVDARHVGPALAGVTERRTAEWIMNMILDPEKMVKEDAAARKLLEEYLSPMANQSLTEEEARAILEYFRKTDAS
ncbi:MAG TPA: cytochrome c [Bacteroidia bacterium]|nr:cytochrome c [Bacteroidia bacterium]HNT80819.1 cytochrome c [Bacteroidia bacterium]